MCLRAEGIVDHGQDRTRRLYGRVVLAWLLGVFLLPAALTGLLTWAADARCDAGATDCSWGLEVLLVLPVLALSLVTVGPLAVYLLLHRLGDPLAGSTTRWVLLLVLGMVPAVFVLAGFALLLPPLGGRYLALRRAVPARRE